MFRLNRLTDYAVVVMSQMALRGGETRSAQQISDDTGVPLPTVAKLLNLLGRAKLVASQRGASGGYILRGEPETITVAKIIQAMEGPIALPACVEGATDCRSEEHTSELQSLMRISYAVFCLKKKKKKNKNISNIQ